MNYWPVVAVLIAWFTFFGYARILLGAPNGEEE